LQSIKLFEEYIIQTAAEQQLLYSMALQHLTLHNDATIVLLRDKV